MFKILPEMRVGYGLVTTKGVSNSPSGNIDIQDGRIVFIKEKEQEVKGNKKIVFCDNYLQILNFLFYFKEDLINEYCPGCEFCKKNGDECYTTNVTPRIISKLNEIYVDASAKKEILSFIIAFKDMVSLLLKEDFELFFYIKSTLVRFECLDFLNDFLSSVDYASNDEISNLFAERNVPSDHLYIIDLAKAVQIVSNHNVPSLINHINAMLKQLYCYSSVIGYSSQTLQDDTVIYNEVMSDDQIFGFDSFNITEDDSKTIKLNFGLDYSSSQLSSKIKELQEDNKITVVSINEVDSDNTKADPPGCAMLSRLVSKLPNVKYLDIYSYKEFEESDNISKDIINSGIKGIRFLEDDISRDFFGLLDWVSVNDTPETYFYEPGNISELYSLNIYIRDYKPLIKRTPYIDFIISEDMVTPISCIPQKSGDNIVIKIDRYNIKLENIADLLNKENKASYLYIVNIDCEAVLLLLRKISISVRSNIKELQLNVINASFGNISSVIEAFPNLMCLQIGRESLLNNDVLIGNIVDFANDRKIRRVNITNYTPVECDVFFSYLGGFDYKYNQDECSVRMNLNSSKASYNIRKIFFSNQITTDPDPRDYRTKVFSSLIDVNALFTNDGAIYLDLIRNEKNINEISQLPPCDIFLNSDCRAGIKDEECFGTITTTIDDDWISLPSIQINEKLIKISILDCNNQPVNFKLGYCDEADLYCVKIAEADVKNDYVVTVNFVLSVESDVECTFNDDEEAIFSDDKIHKLTRILGSFNLDNINKINLDACYNKPIRDYLCKLYKKQAGACIERSLIFTHLVQKNNILSDKNVRIISNDLHSYCEVRLAGAWVKIDFGGSPADVEVYDPLNKVNSTKVEQVDHVKESISQEKVPIFYAAAEIVTKSVLIEISFEAVDGYALSLLQFYKSKCQPVCYINNIKDLSCKDYNFEFVNFVNDSKCNANSQAILIVSLKNFNGEEIVRINSIFDPKPNINGVNIPNNVKVIVLHDSSIISAEDSSFYSRFDDVFIPDPLFVGNYKSPIKTLSNMELEKLESENEDGLIIHLDCYGANNWRNVFGTWRMQSSELVYMENEKLSVLNQIKNTADYKIARHSPVSIIINNPPITEDFRIFWEKVCINKFIVYRNLRYNNIDKVYFSNKKNYVLSEKIITWIPSDRLATDYYVLNSSVFEEFFKLYSFNNGMLQIMPGYVEEYSNKGSLNVLLTHNISNQKWSRLLDECNKHNVVLNVSAASEVRLPSGFKPNDFVNKPIVNSRLNRCVISESLDLKFNCVAFNVSEHDVENLVNKLDYAPEKNEYNLVCSDLIALLSSGETVVLYGRLSLDFSEKFASMLVGSEPYLTINGVKQFFTGKLYCIPDSQSLCNFKYASSVNIDECDFIIDSKNSERLPISIFDETNDPRGQMIARAENMKQMFLLGLPVVYITGKTGIGKSAFINEVIGKNNGYIVFNELDNILAWANNITPDCIKILFVDEANMLGSDFLMFDSMFLSHRYIMHDGKILNLTPMHVVVLAGNPCQYGGDRKLPLLVQKHPYIELEFCPLTQQSMSKIIFNMLDVFGIDKSGIGGRISKLLLEIYEHMSQLDDEHVYVTAREIKLALYLLKNKYHWYFIVKMLFINALPEKYKQITIHNFGCSEVDLETKVKAMISSHNIPIANNEYFIFNSRRFALLGLHSILSLRNTSSSIAGIIFSGPPATGKSEFVRFALDSQGYTKLPEPDAQLDSKISVIKYFENIEIGNKQYITCNASASLDVRKQQLLSAYIHGVVVVFDEFNSALKGLERLLNDLLMHQYQGVSAKKTGFMLIGTQNGINLPGRCAMTEAMLRRFVSIDLPPYTKLELMQILRHKNLFVKDHTLIESIDKFFNTPIIFRSGLRIQNNLRLLSQEVHKHEQKESEEWIKEMSYLNTIKF